MYLTRKCHTISNALRRKGWSEKIARQKAKERNPDLRNDYYYLLADFAYTTSSTSMNLDIMNEEHGCALIIDFHRSTLKCWRTV